MWQWLKRKFYGPRPAFPRLTIDVYLDHFNIHCDWPDIKNLDPGISHQMALSLATVGHIMTATNHGRHQITMAVAKRAHDTGDIAFGELVLEAMGGVRDQMLLSQVKGKNRNNEPVVRATRAFATEHGNPSP